MIYIDVFCVLISLLFYILACRALKKARTEKTSQK